MTMTNLRRTAATGTGAVLPGLGLLALASLLFAQSPAPDDQSPSIVAEDRAAEIADASGIAFECRTYVAYGRSTFFGCRDDVAGMRVEVVVTRWDPRHPPKLSPSTWEKGGRVLRREDPFPVLPEGTAYLVAALLRGDGVRAIGYAALDTDLARTDVYVRGDEQEADGTWVSTGGFLDHDDRPMAAMLDWVLNEPEISGPYPEQMP